jgi:hypothetical protein
MLKIVLHGGAIPAPPVVARAEAKQPPGTLLAAANHVCKIAHDAAHVALMHVGKETLVDLIVGRIFEDRTSSARERLNVAVSIKGKKREMWNASLSEALPTLTEKGRRRSLRRCWSRLHKHKR